jgi:hypothetical protein
LARTSRRTVTFFLKGQIGGLEPSGKVSRRTGTFVERENRRSGHFLERKVGGLKPFWRGRVGRMEPSGKDE